MGSVVILHQSRLLRSKLTFTFKCLYNAASLPCFTFCLNRKDDVFSLIVVPGVVKFTLFIQLVFSVLKSSELLLS